MSVEIVQSNAVTLNKREYGGAPLGKLIDHLTTLQAHGVPDDAQVSVAENNYGRVVTKWKEARG